LFVPYRQDMPSAIEPQKPHSVAGAASRFGCWGPWACRSSRNASRMAPASRKADSKIKGLFRIALICPENGTIPRQPVLGSQAATFKSTHQPGRCGSVLDDRSQCLMISVIPWKVFSGCTVRRMATSAVPSKTSST
jgi:hypothetical protein